MEELEAIALEPSGAPITRFLRETQHGPDSLLACRVTYEVVEDQRDRSFVVMSTVVHLLGSGA